MADLLIAGSIRRPHGIRGELQINVDTDRPDVAFRRGRVLSLGQGAAQPTGRSVTVERFRPVKGGGILQLRESGTREQAEALRGFLLLLDAAEAAPAREGEVLYRDLVGMEVLADGESVGTVEEVLDTAGGELLLVRRANGKELLVPFVGEMVRRIDVEGRHLELDPPEGLLEL